MDEWARPAEPRCEVDVFATGDTMLVDRDERPDLVADAVRRGHSVLRDLQARPGYRPGVHAPAIATSGRRSGTGDIVHPVLIDPRMAVEIAMHRLFVDPIRGIVLTTTRPDVQHRLLVWNGRLTGVGRHGIDVSLHLLASPSLVVTVLELVPQRRLGHRRRAFIRAGVDVVERLAERLVAAPA